MTCPFTHLPHDCFPAYQHSLLLKRNRHPWESIGDCDGCKFARPNAIIAHVAEEDSVDSSNMRWSPIDPADFLEEADKPKAKKVSKKLTCKAGHRYATHGTKRKDGGWRCRPCVAARKAAKYQARKAA